MNLFGRKSDATGEEREKKAQEEFKEEFDSLLGHVKLDEHSETFYNGNLMIVGTHLTQVCHSTGASPKQVVATYGQVMGELMSWFNMVPLKERLEDMLDERVWSKWSPKEQPVESMYTPQVNRMKRSNSDHQSSK